MKMRLTLSAALMVCLAATAVAQLSPETVAWGQGSYQFLLTKQEATTWKSIRGEAEAKAFIDLFWARRDPTPGTPANEYKMDIDARIAFADANFVGERARGSMTDRAKTLLLFGQPKRASRSGAQAPGAVNPESMDDVSVSTSSPSIIWIYEGDAAKASFGISPAEVPFTDRMGTGQFRLDRARFDMTKAQQRAIERTITQANLTAAPTFQAAVPSAPVAPAAPVAAAVVTELTTEALKSAVAEVKAAAKNPYDGKVHVVSGEYVTSLGEYFVPVGLYVPKGSGLSGEVTFFGVVEDATGKSVLAFEQPATLVATKDDFYIDRSLTGLPAGKHRGYFGLAQGGNVVALAAKDLELAGTLDKDATGTSQLLLSNNVFPLTESQKANDPYAFGGVRVIPKADGVFRTSDELWYFVELRNPGVAEPTLPEGTVPVDAAAVELLPKLQVKIDMNGKDSTGKDVKKSAPPTQIDAIAMKGVPGHYGIGSAFPLTSFKPGDYTFTIKVIDTVKKASYTLSEKFKVVE